MIPARVLVEGIESLPPLPEAVARLGPLLKDERATVDKFEQAVRSDAAITANLFKAANSAYYQGAGPVRQLREAVTRIGLQRVYEVALGTGFRQTLPRRLPGYGLDGGAFWLHCAATALFAEALAAQLRLPCSDSAYVAGLLHDAGKLVIGGFLAVEVPEANWWTFGTAQAERDLLGSHHGEVGLEIARRWHLPPPVGLACRWHHEPADAPEEAALLAAVIHAADTLAYRAGFFGGSCDGVQLDATVAARLGFTPEVLERLEAATRDALFQLGEASPSRS